MASSSIRAGAAFVELTTKDSALVKGLDRAAQRLRAFGASVRQIGLKIVAAGAAVFAPLLAATRVFSTVGDNLQKMAQRTGLSVEALSELAFAAEQSGASGEDLEAGLRGMQRFIGELAQGSSSARRVLRALGITTAQIASATPEKRLELIADALAKVQDPALKAALAMELFGRSGTKLLPLLADGAAGINELRKQARGLGLTITAAEADAAAKFNDTMEAMWRVLKQAAFVIGSALAPLVQRFAEIVTRVTVRVNEWVRQNRELVQTVFKIAAVVTLTGTALVGVGAAISALGLGIAGVSIVLKTFGALLGFVGSAIVALLSPIGLVTAAVVALGVSVLKESGAAGGALRWLGDRFADLKSTATTAWGEIGAALAAGDVALAAKILWLTLKLEFQKGVAALTDLWTSFRFAFQRVFTQAAFGILETWTNVTAALSSAWQVFLSESSKALETARNFFTKQFIKLMGVFDEEIDVEAAVRMADEDLAQSKADSDRQAQERIAQTESERDEKLSALESAREAALAELEGDASDRFRKTAEAVEEAREEWRKAIEDAKKESPRSGETPGGPHPPEDDPLRSASDSLSGAASALWSLADRQATLGTFNAAAILSLQGSDGTEERTAKATEETARNTRRLLAEARDNGLAFT